MDAEQLHQLFLKQGSVCTDSRAITKGCLFFALSGDNFNGNQFAKIALKEGAAFAVIDDKSFIDSKQSQQYILVNDSLKALQQLSTAHRDYCNTPIIALTGSNGKTTTKELIHAVLKTQYNTLATKGNFNNHIGVPLTLLQLTKDTEIAIVEMGANHLKEIELLSNIAKPNYGYITNFGLAHLEGFGSKEGVIKGKSELYYYLKEHQQTIFYNPRDHKQKELLSDYDKKIACPKDSIEIEPNKKQLSIIYKNTKINSKLIGNYNADNIAAAIGIGEYFKIDLKSIKEAIESYTPTNNRSQLVEHNSNTIILDAYNANPSSMKAALENFKQLQTKKKKVLILGDMLELGEYAKEAHKELLQKAEEITTERYLVGKEFKSIYNQSFTETNDLIDHLKNKPINNSYILIKGSRGIALERLLDII